MACNTLVITEKDVLTEILRLYQQTTCLWNPSHEFYSNQNKRKQHYMKILEKYRVYVPDANLSDLKRKIDNMRHAYKREYEKVQKCRMKGNYDYTPTLWYYKLLTFLNGGKEEIDHIETDDKDDQEEDDPYVIFQEEYQPKKEDTSPETPAQKKRKRSDTAYPEEDFDRLEQSFSLEQPTPQRHETSADAFGRTVGMQLSELHPMQRFIAEKLISDVIFLARSDKLHPDMNLTK